MTEHSIDISPSNPDGCRPIAPDRACHPAGHIHGPGCGHPAVPHGDHLDYLVDGRLHHPHRDAGGAGGGHCDDHGAVEIVEG